MATTIIDFIPGINTLKLAKKDESVIISQARKAAKEIARLDPDLALATPRSPGKRGRVQLHCLELPPSGRVSHYGALMDDRTIQPRLYDPFLF